MFWTTESKELWKWCRCGNSWLGFHKANIRIRKRRMVDAMGQSEGWWSPGDDLWRIPELVQKNASSAKVLLTGARNRKISFCHCYESSVSADWFHMRNMSYLRVSSPFTWKNGIGFRTYKNWRYHSKGQVKILLICFHHFLCPVTTEDLHQQKEIIMIIIKSKGREAL